MGKNNSENKKEIYLKLLHLTLERHEQYHDTSKSMTQATFYQTCQKLFLWSKVAFLDQNVVHGLEHSHQSTFSQNMLIKALSLTSYCFFQHVYCIIGKFKVIFVLTHLNNFRHHEILPTEGWQRYINCGQWPTTGGPTHAIPLPNLFSKRVPIT